MAHGAKHLLLIDIDSVLVEALGYLIALQDTVGHFSRKMGVGNHPLFEVEARTFEAQGLTSEWDSGAACVGLLLAERMRLEPELVMPARWTDALSFLGRRPRSVPRPDYGMLAQLAGARVAEGVPPAQAARGVLQEMVEVHSAEQSASSASRLLDILLGCTHDFYRAPVTRHFQHLVIGSDGIRTTYGVAPDFKSPPYLMLYDRPLIDPDSSARLAARAGEGTVGVSLYTARPSLPPVEAIRSGGDVAMGFSPEAETARSLVGLDGIPLIGAGHMRWLAREADDEVEHLEKPSPVHALAAMGAASSGQEAGSLLAALALHRDGSLGPPLSDLEGVTVHVFEDTVGGIAAAERAVGELQAAGLEVGYELYGVVAEGPKATAMARRGVAAYSCINEAIAVALARAT